MALSVSRSNRGSTNRSATNQGRRYLHARQRVYRRGRCIGVIRLTSLGLTKRAEAIAVRGDRILAVGTRDEITKMKGPQTKVVDLGGHFVMPGFNDAHMHLASAGLEKLNVNLVGTKTLDEFRERLRAKVEAAGPGDWVVGEGWDETLWPVKTPPTRWDLDEVSGDHPVFLVRVDGHIAVANTRALQLASVTVATKDPDGGKIDRDEGGTPTGILREKAQDAVWAVIPKPTHEKRRQCDRECLGRPGQPRRHVRAGLFYVGGFSDLRRT